MVPCWIYSTIRPANIKPLLSVARDNFDLTEYLIGQVIQSESHRLAALDQYFPGAKSDDWKLQVAGQRVEIIKPDVKRGGMLRRLEATRRFIRTITSTWRSRRMIR